MAGASQASARLVCVTGASGFIAAHVVRELLERGHRVRGTVRSLAQPERYEYLTTLPGADERLELVEADLLTTGSCDAAVAGCEAVIHTASPYVIDVADPQKELVNPALEGTRNVLASCAASSSLERVVLTSSVAAITDEPLADHVFTEADWNELSSLARNPYYFSKVLAEREAWGFVERTNPAWDLVVINPLMTIGPSLGPTLNESNAILVNILSGAFPAIIGLTWGLVDVRDVALAHVLAMEKADATGRHICAAENQSMRSVVSALKELGYGSRYKMPGLDMSGPIGTFIAKLAARRKAPGTRAYLETHLGKTLRFDNRRIRSELGIAFRPVRETLVDAVIDLEHWKHIGG